MLKLKVPEKSMCEGINWCIQLALLLFCVQYKRRDCFSKLAQLGVLVYVYLCMQTKSIVLKHQTICEAEM